MNTADNLTRPLTATLFLYQHDCTLATCGAILPELHNCVTPNLFSQITTRIGHATQQLDYRPSWEGRCSQQECTLRAHMQLSRTRAARSAPLKPWQAGLAPMALTSTSTARGVRRVRACRMDPLPSGGGNGTYKILSSLPGLQQQHLNK